MEVILRKDIDRLGESGDRIQVKDGYARNYLIPQGLAYELTPSSLAMVAEERRQSEIRAQRVYKSATELAEAIEKTSLTVKVLVGQDDKIFGSVTSQVIADLLAEKGIEVDRRKIHLDEPIKSLGVFDIPIRLHTDVEAKVKVWVVK
jgi:large subunit ribosomal protein L9